MSTQAQRDRAEAVEMLKRFLKKGDRVYCILAKVAPSGMSREIKLYKVGSKGEQFLSGYAAKALGLRMGKHDGVVVHGGGMDMGFHLVYELSRAMFGDPRALQHVWL